MTAERTALVVVDTVVADDPRVRRQLEWLTSAGWVVDTIGEGATPPQGARRHFMLLEAKRWTSTSLGTVVAYVLLPRAAGFTLLRTQRVPKEVRRRVKANAYGLYVFNDMHFAPWADSSDFATARESAVIHLDIHEYFPSSLPQNSMWNRATTPMRAWVRRSMASSAFTSRTTVARGISDLYAEELGIRPPDVVRNSPGFVDQQPSVTSASEVRLVHHGNAMWARGLKLLVDAVALANDRVSVTFMLTGSPAVISELEQYAAQLGDRVRVVPPVPIDAVAEEINKYDLEVMFYRPATVNLQLALPNKLFEAIQGRLGLVIGQSPSMMEIVEDFQNGVVVEGWEPADLAAAIDRLDAEKIGAFKQGSDRAAAAINAKTEGEMFLASIAKGLERR